MIKVLYFGRLSDVAGRREETFELPKNVSSLSDLKIWLSDTHELGDALEEQSVKMMVNQKLILDDLTLKGDEEIGFLPPVGGG